MKLNVGCAESIMEGYINIDLHPEEYPLVRDKILPADIRALPFKNESIDEVYASHIIEHFTYADAVLCLTEWRRVLKTDGKLIVIVPDMHIIARNWIKE